MDKMEKIFDDAVAIAMPKIKSDSGQTSKDALPTKNTSDHTVSNLGESSSANKEEVNLTELEKQIIPASSTSQTNITNPMQTNTTISTMQTNAVNSFEREATMSEKLVKILRFACIMFAVAFLRKVFNYYTDYQENRLDNNPNLQQQYQQYAPIPGGYNPYIHFGPQTYSDPSNYVAG